MIVLAGCNDDRPKVAGSAAVAKDHPARGAIWPILLQHCLRSPSCDPMDDFGDGAGQASGLAGGVLWFAETAEVVREGGQDYGGRITLSLNGPALVGGKAGRPLTLDETPSTLRAQKDRQTWLSVEYRLPSSEPEPYFLALRTAQLKVETPGLDDAKSDVERSDRTADYLAGLVWPKSEEGDGGARLALSVGGKALWSGQSIGLPVEAPTDKAEPGLGFAPWNFYISRNLRDEPLADLMSALNAGETLRLVVSIPSGDALLEDSLGADGFPAALAEARAALDDPAIKSPLAERCAAYAGVGNAVMAELRNTGKLSPAQLACDARTPAQQLQAPPKADPRGDDELRRLRDEKDRAPVSDPASAAPDR